MRIHGHLNPVGIVDILMAVPVLVVRSDSQHWRSLYAMRHDLEKTKPNVNMGGRCTIGSNLTFRIVLYSLGPPGTGWFSWYLRTSASPPT